jgi:hypothetical protein
MAKARKTKKDKALEQHIERSAMPIAHKIEQRFYDDFDDIYAWYHDPTGKVTLSEKQKEQLERWNFAREWYTTWEGVANRELVTAIVKQFGVSEKQGYVDVQNMKRFYASLENFNKDFERVMMLERLRKQKRRLQADGSVKAEIALIKLEELLAKVGGLYEPENQIPAPVVVEIAPVSDPTLLGLEVIDETELLKVLKVYGKKKEIQQTKEFEDVDFEMIHSDGSSEH